MSDEMIRVSEQSPAARAGKVLSFTGILVMFMQYKDALEGLAGTYLPAPYNQIAVAVIGLIAAVAAALSNGSAFTVKQEKHYS